MESHLHRCHGGHPPWLATPPPHDGWFGRSAFALIKRTCFLVCETKLRTGIRRLMCGMQHQEQEEEEEDTPGPWTTMLVTPRPHRLRGAMQRDVFVMQFNKRKQLLPNSVCTQSAATAAEATHGLFSIFHVMRHAACVNQGFYFHQQGLFPVH